MSLQHWLLTKQMEAGHCGTAVLAWLQAAAEVETVVEHLGLTTTPLVAFRAIFIAFTTRLSQGNCATVTRLGLHAHAMASNKDNANPTILSASDLPSRRREVSVKKRDDGGTGLFDDLIPPYNYLSDAFERPPSATDSDDDSVEDIDEQEIYGTPSLLAYPPRSKGPANADF
jgi:hypothetical protein